MTRTRIPSSPYKGLIPYSEEDAAFFFGREQDREIITNNLLASRLTVLYGPSGVGKSSVLRAGVAHHLRRNMEQSLTDDEPPEYAVVVFNSWSGDPVTDLINAVRNSVRRVVKGDSENLVPPSRKLSQSLLTWTKLNPDNELPNIDLLIILDQFEEYFLYHANEDQEDTFATEFPQAVNDPNLCVNFLISIRDDALSKLDFFKESIPHIVDNRLSISHLDQKSARDAIIKPLGEYNRLVAPGGEQIICPDSVEDILRQSDYQVGIEPALVETILRQIRTGQVIVGQAGRGVIDSGNGVDTGGTQIETPYLQLVMSRLWKAEKTRGSRVMRLKTLEELGGADRIVLEHLDETMNSLPVAEQDKAARIFYHLVTPSGTKIAHKVSDLASFAGVTPRELSPVLTRLSGYPERILRPVAASVNDPRSQRYEIFHDVLAPAILDWRVRHIQAQQQIEARKQAEEQAARMEKEATARIRLEQAEALARAERQRVEEQQRRIDEQNRARKKLLWIMLALVLMLLIAVAAMKLAQDRKSEAEALATAAAEARRIAEEEKVFAQEQTVIAASQKALADNQRYIAEEERQRAEGLRRLANSRETQAVRAREQHALLIDQIRTDLEGEALNLAAQGESSKAIEIYTRLLPVYKKTGLTDRLVEVLTITARLYRRIGENDKAEEFESLLARVTSPVGQAGKGVKKNR